MKTLDSHPRLEVRLLGRFEMRIDGRLVDLSSRPAQSLLAYLVLSAGTAHRREKLAGMLWPDADEENGRSYLRHALWRIRKATTAELPSDGHYLITDDLSIGFDPKASYWLDVAEFESDDQERTNDLMTSLGAYRGELLPGFYDDWAVLERERLDAVLPRKMQRLIDRLSDERRWPEVIEWAERWISLGGTPESAYRALMVAHHAQGDRARLAAAYRRCVEALKRELDVAPSDQTRQVYEELSRASSTATAALIATPVADTSAAGSSASAEPPFKGLQYFDEADADLFFGRETLVARLVGRLRGTSFLAVVGASGSGKSSILRAGIVAALRRGEALADGSRPPEGSGTWRIHVITPTAHPLEALAASLTPESGSTSATADLLDDLARDPRSLRLHLRKARTRTLLAVDQFEELFTLCRDPFEREAFIDDLLAAAEPDREGTASVVLALRADFYAHCADFPALRDAVAQHQEYIGPMGSEELRRAIESPASKEGWTLAPGLADILLHDVGDEPGALPLLSHALLETWQRRRGRTLTLEGYAKSGGVRGAIARTAESVFDRLTEEQQAIARRIFLRLTELGEGTQDTRRRVSMDELLSVTADVDAVRAVLRLLADARLITTAERSVDIAHEALIREWPRLRTWLDEDRDTLRVQRELTRAALEWERLGRDAGSLYRGVRLAQALDRARYGPEELNELELTFLDAARAEAEREEREREEARRRELEAAHQLAAAERTAAVRLRRRALYLTLALLFLAGTAGAAIFFAEQARASAAVAQLEQRRVLLESARAAAANVDSRLGALRSAIAPADLHRSLSLRARDVERDGSSDLPGILTALKLFAGPEASALFITEYVKDELVAIDDPVACVGRPRPCSLLAPSAAAASPGARETAGARADAARRQLAGTAPRVPSECLRGEGVTIPGPPAKLLQSAPYELVAGQPPAVAMIHYGPACFQPYALVLEASLGRANEWMGVALAPGDDAYLLDQTGRLLARARRSETDYLRDLTGAGLVAAALASSEGFVRDADDPLGGGARLAAAAPVGDTGWRVIVLRPASAAQSLLEASLGQFLVLGAVMAVLLLGAFAVRRTRASERPA